MKLITAEDLNTRIPFACEGDMNTIKRGLRHRKKVIQKFIDRPDFDGLKALDIGRPNKFSREMKVVDNTMLDDLNRSIRAPRRDYEVVTCFEVIEHVMDPLFMMDSIHYYLDHGGVCYLSTPVSRFPGWYHSKAHFVEYKRDRLEKMFKYVGFEIVKYRTFLLWDPEFMFFGFRPLWRVLFTRNHLWELRKP